MEEVKEKKLEKKEKEVKKANNKTKAKSTKSKKEKTEPKKPFVWLTDDEYYSLIYEDDLEWGIH